MSSSEEQDVIHGYTYRVLPSPPAQAFFDVIYLNITERSEPEINHENAAGRMSNLTLDKVTEFAREDALSL